MDYAKRKVAENLHVPEIVETVRGTGSRQLTQFEKRFPYLNQTLPARKTNEKQRDKQLKKIRRLANWLDNAVPHSPIPLGVDSVLGFIPLVGGSMSSLLSLYQVYLSTLFGIPLWLFLLMIFNIVVDFIFSLIPIAGGFLHLFYKANIYNYEELRNYVESPEYMEQLKIRESGSSSSKDIGPGEITWTQLGIDIKNMVPSIPFLAKQQVQKKSM